MRQSFLTGLVILGAALGPVLAEDTLQEYVYYPDGTYAKRNEAGSAIKDFTGDASANGVGTLEIYGGNDSETDSFYGLRGSYGMSVFDSAVVQLDAGYHSAVSDDFSGKLHVGRKFGDKVVAGVFVGAGKLGSGTSAVESQSLGLEAAWQADDFTIFGAGSFGNASANGKDGTAASFELGGRYYWSDNLAFTASLRSKGVGDDKAAAGYADGILRADYRPDGSRFSVFGEYGYRGVSATVNNKTTSLSKSHRVSAGAKVHFGSTSLKAEERGGLFWSAFQ